MVKTFCFTNCTTNYNKIIMKLISKMGWDIICKEEWEILTRIEVYIPEDDMDVFKFIFEDLF